MPSPIRYGWYAKRLDRRKASIRLRLFGPIAALRPRGIDVEPYARAREASYDAIIFSKSFSPFAIATARRAEAAGKAVIVDICDNMFEQAARQGRSAKRDRIAEQLRRARLVTVATPMLAEQLLRHLPEIAPKLRVVPDMLEDVAHAPGPSLLDRWRLARLRGFLDRHDGALHCVWFGSSFGTASGLVHLAEAAREIAAFAARHPITLTVISDDRKAYRRMAADWSFPHSYLPWALGTFADALKLHRVALVPVGRNDYTVGKTINRPATALLAGLGVVADAIESYEELRPFVALDDWQGGLARYANGWEAEQPRLAAARMHLEDRYGTNAVADLWEAALAEIAPPN